MPHTKVPNVGLPKIPSIDVADYTEKAVKHFSIKLIIIHFFNDSLYCVGLFTSGNQV